MNISIASKEWLDMIRLSVENIGDDEFYRRLAECGEYLTGYKSTVILAFVDKEKPIMLYSNLSEKDELSTLAPYFKGAYLLDPLYSLYRRKIDDGIFELKVIAPEDFFETEYYLDYYKKTRIIDEVCLLIKASNEVSIAISYGLREEDSPKDFYIETLQMIFPVLVACCKKNWSYSSQSRLIEKSLAEGSQFGDTLDKAFSNFGKQYLTSRECEIVHLILKGYSSKSISELLFISLETVKVHRKRLHAKLNINSQAELFSLFLEAISLVPLSISDEDPLAYYFKE